MTGKRKLLQLQSSPPKRKTHDPTTNTALKPSRILRHFLQTISHPTSQLQHSLRCSNPPLSTKPPKPTSTEHHSNHNTQTHNSNTKTSILRNRYQIPIPEKSRN
ncbi:hypothetical protein M758_3G234900 [Ceratodon purpureus]|nr:hypothetical protein M758_3G234900 [Ceratodon purpureus]